LIALVLNPRSRENRLYPERRERLARRLGEHGEVLAPGSLEELDATAAALRARPPSVIAISGGDGTLHRVVTALIHAFGDAPLPPLAFVGGGTMNVVRSSLGLRADTPAFLDHLVATQTRGQPHDTFRRRCIDVAGRYGFIFGNGLVANFLDAYYEGGQSGQGRAAWLLGRTLGSALIGGPFRERLFRRFRGRVTVDGQVLGGSDHVAVLIATVSEVGFGMKLNPQADQDPERMSVLVLEADALALLRDVPSVRLGWGLAPGHGQAHLATRAELTPDDGQNVFTLDGDMYRESGTLVVKVGPHLDLVRGPA